MGYTDCAWGFRKLCRMVDSEFIRKRITAIRSAKDVPARKLSLDLGYSADACNQIERGRANATIDFILVFCEYFKISLGEFFDYSVEFPTQFFPLLNDLKKLSSEELNEISVIVHRFIINKKK